MLNSNMYISYSHLALIVFSSDLMTLFVDCLVEVVLLNKLL